MVNQSVYAVFADCWNLGDVKLFFDYDNAKKYFDTVVSENEPEGNVYLERLAIEDAAGINEFDNPTDASDNYKKADKVLSNVDVETIAKACSAITTLISNMNIDADYEKRLCEVNEKVADILNIGRALKTHGKHNKCPKCGRQLYLSDLPQYDYVCPWCDENF